MFCLLIPLIPGAVLVLYRKEDTRITKHFRRANWMARVW